MVDVRVEHLRHKADFGRFIGVLLRELERELERAILPDCVLGTNDDCRPFHYVILLWASYDVGVIFGLNLLEVPHQPLRRLRCHEKLLIFKFYAYLFT
jgi:hypothetical protein